MHDNLIHGVILNGSNQGEDIFIPRITLTDRDNFTFPLSQTSIPSQNFIRNDN